MVDVSKVLPSYKDIIRFRSATSIDKSDILRAYRDYFQQNYQHQTINSIQDSEWHFMSLLSVIWHELQVDEFCVSSIQYDDGVFLAPLDKCIDIYVQYNDLLNNNLLSNSARAVHDFVESCWSSGYILFVPKGVHVAGTLDISNVIKRSGMLSIEKILVVVEEGASLTVRDGFVRADNSQQCIVRSLDYIVCKNASLEVVHEHDAALDVKITEYMRFYMEKQSNLLVQNIIVGEGHIVQMFDSILAGEQANVNIKGGYALHNQQHVAIMANQIHQAQSAQSSVLMHGVVTGSAQAFYKGTIVVEKDAHKSLATQYNKNIILSKDAYVFSEPRLEIETDEVRCAHGSAVGSFDIDRLFYMQSRGLCDKQAKRMLLRAFFEQCCMMYDKIARDYLLRKVVEKLLL